MAVISQICRVQRGLSFVCFDLPQRFGKTELLAPVVRFARPLYVSPVQNMLVYASLLKEKR